MVRKPISTNRTTVHILPVHYFNPNALAPSRRLHQYPTMAIYKTQYVSFTSDAKVDPISDNKPRKALIEESLVLECRSESGIVEFADHPAASSIRDECINFVRRLLLHSVAPVVGWTGPTTPSRLRPLSPMPERMARSISACTLVKITEFPQ